MKAILALADGRIFEGTAFGAQGEVNGEIVFNQHDRIPGDSNRSFVLWANGSYDLPSHWQLWS